MRHPLKIVSLAIAGLLASQTVSLRADELAEQGRDILKKYQHAVVTVQVVLKVSSGTRTQEAKQDVTAVVVDPSGLAVLSLSAADPTELNRRLFEDYKVDTEISDIKILLEDGTEVLAEVVLRDRDQDLAFIRPKTKPATPMAAVDLSKSGQAQVLDQVIALNRLNRAAGRAYSASVERISAVVSKPRLFYVPDSTQTSTGLGSPIFATNGNILGIVVYRTIPSRGGGGSASGGYAPIVLPAEDILKAAKQAPDAAKPDEEKKEPKEKTDK